MKECRKCGIEKFIMRKLTKTSLTKKIDKVCSEVVRRRGYCVWCGGGLHSQLQAAHIFSRNNRSVRWDLNNILCLCAKCHFRAHQYPILFVEFIKGFLGEYEYQKLKIRANQIKRWTLGEMIDLYNSFLLIADSK